MSCYHPLRAIITGYTEEGKKILKILPKSDFIYEDPSVEYITIPCGRCIGCRLKYSRTWADRCMAEASYHDSNLFLTLTYNDDYLPKPLNYTTDNGDIKVSPVSPLVKRDVQLFIKRLRKKFPDQKIRYFACGEYGGKSMRPHYHLILFGLSLSDLQLRFKNDQEFRYFTSESISDLWKYGYHLIASVNWQVCAYVARYIVKKQYGKGSWIYDHYNFPPEFTLMSRKPGIGRQFYDDHKLKLYGDDVYLSLPDGAHRIMPNKYYDYLYDIEYPDHMFGIREERKKVALINEQLKSNLTNLSYLDRLKTEETVQETRIRSLQRKEL